MSQSRPAIPAQLGREVLMEAGHRCAIPTCRHAPAEIHHIEPWAKVREHRFENLIALCPNCHARFDRKEIDRKSMLQYKANLSILTGRYGDVEQRILKLFADQHEASTIWLPGGWDLVVMHLVQDGLLVPTGVTGGLAIGGVPSTLQYGLTKAGREFVNRWLAAQPLE